jgi:hypothetical protein
MARWAWVAQPVKWGGVTTGDAGATGGELVVVDVVVDVVGGGGSRLPEVITRWVLLGASATNSPLP